MVGNVQSSPAGPASPWTNYSRANGTTFYGLFGYQVTTVTGTLSYAGTGGNTTFGWAACVASLFGGAVPITDNSVFAYQAVSRASTF